MANAFEGTEGDRHALEAPLLEIDPELNIFALANGLDLLRNRSDAPDRTLEWYREGMERRILIRADGPDRYRVTCEASKGKDASLRRAESGDSETLSAEALRRELRRLLADGIEKANGLGEDDLRPAS